MKMRDSQVDALAAATMDRARREHLLELRKQGFGVSEDAATKSIIVRDAAGCSARAESRGLVCRVISPEGRVTETEQYPGGRIRRIVDPSGREVRFERDADGFLHSIDRGLGGGTFDFKLSEDWKPLRIDYPDGTSSLAEYSTTGSPTRVIQRDGTELRYEYTSDGHLKSLIDPKGQRTELADRGPGVSRSIEYPNGDRHAYFDDLNAHVLRFDVNGKTHAIYQRGAEPGTIETQYLDGSRERFVFKDGRIIEATNEHSTLKFEYDDAGRLVTEDANGRVLRYVRNEVGALVGIVTPAGATISYTRDRDQRLTGITDWRGDHYEILLPPSGPPSEIRYPNGLTVAMTTNEMGLPRTWSVRSSAALEEEVDSASWEHDLCDRLVAATRNRQRREYHYSKVSRLVEVRCSDTKLSESFELDSRGNRIQSAGDRCEYDAVNRLLRQGTQKFAYDGLGNQTEVRDGRHVSTYRYNGRGQLVSIRTKGLVVDYEYDALGRRICKRLNGVTTRFEWAGTQLLSETVDDGKKIVSRDYLFCAEFLTPLAFREGISVYYIHCGRLQEPLCVTDRGGQVVWKADYLAFGRALISVDRVRQSLRLPGQYHDVETELHYAVARYYAPELGRFLSMDPHRQPGASLNYYTYCDGDPVNRLDPIGEIGLTLGTVLTAIAVGVVVGAAVGAGVELYKQRNEEHIDWGQVGYAALIGGCLGGIGMAVFTVGAAALAGALGVVGAGAVAGGLSGAVTYCVQAVGTGHWDWGTFGLAVGAGAAAGAVTAGVGGFLAARAATRAAEEAAAREAEEELARQAAKEAADKAAQEAAEEAARQAAQQAEQEALEKAARDAAQRAKIEPDKGGLTKAGRSLAKHASGQRPGAKGFPPVQGTPQDINEQAAKALDDILNDPSKTVKVRPGKGGEEIMQVNRPDGTGAIFKKGPDGQWQFSHFAENLF